MANWKELGEVPDSEEEDGFDSDDFDPSPTPVITTTVTTDPTTAARPTTDRNQQQPEIADIWDIPDSPQSQHNLALPTPTHPREPELAATSLHATQALPDSSPLSSARSDQDLPSVDRLLGRWWSPGRSNSPQPTNLGGSHQEDDVSASRIRTTSSIPEFTGGQDLSQSSSRSRPRSWTPPLQSQVLGHDDEDQEARQAAVRYERSLRPRKPIQEHPYILENAHYSSILKQHGIRPVRALIEAERQRRQREGTSQEEEFQQDSQGSRPPDSQEESQATDLRSFPADFGSLELPSSSPPKTSPLNNGARASSQASSQNETDNTSIAGQDLPALEDLLRRPKVGTGHRVTKQKASSPRTTTRKRRRLDVIESDPIEPRTNTLIRVPDSPDPLLAPFLSSPPEQELSLRDKVAQALPSSRSPLRYRDPSRIGDADPALVIESDSDEEADQRPNNGALSGGENSRPESDAERTGSEIMNTVGRRIRGVLPASWLRLDQKSGTAKARKEVQRQRKEQTPDQEQRRGVAQRRRALPGSTVDHFIFDDSDSDVSPQEQTTDEAFHNQTRLALEPAPGVNMPLSLPSDNEGSAVEDNSIEPLFPSRKRQLKLSDSFQNEPRKRKTEHHAARQQPRKPRQPKITNHFDQSRRSEAGPRPRRPPKSNRQQKQANASGKPSKKTSRRVSSAPRLSILDVIEPDAPQFLRVAARTAKQRPNQGRSSPKRKSIKLATRRDHVDAMSVLSDWRSGSIRPRPAVSAARRVFPPPRQDRTLSEISGNSSMSLRDAQRTPSGTDRNFGRQFSNSGAAGQTVRDATQRPPKQSAAAYTNAIRHDQPHSARPAQLETDGADQPSSFEFHARKRLLDRLYQKKQGRPTLESSFGDSGTSIDMPIPTRNSPDAQEESQNDARHPRERQPRRQRFHKRTRPQRIDLEAPEYSHANDPLPAQYSAVPEPSQGDSQNSKLFGLGPYGTHYTHHFEIFPLNSRVYFHDSTLMGSGAIEAVANKGYCAKLMEARPRLSFSLGDQDLRWGPWTSQVSSELGVLLDFLADQLEGSLREGRPPDSSTCLGAATFILDYLRNSLSFAENEGAKSFVARFHEVLQNFNERITPKAHQLASDQGIRYELVLKIYDRLLLVALLILQVCQNDPSLMAEQFQAEELLKSMAKSATSTLLHAGMSEVRKTYHDLDRLSFRERGLRDDRPAIHSWVIVMKVLGLASIPRASFWDTIQAVMATPQALSSLDAQVFEGIWQSMFALLPLVEFNNTGVVMSGQRHDPISDGWALPQKLLKPIFQLYQENPRQPPSFNNYCRALVGRCHYLVQQWGWRKSVTVIGVIFDFFGSQNLEHLRNEEVFKSPRFLDELAGRPVLDIEPEDRCFHVFLKLIALSIRKLRDIGSINDIRNLVARTMPNHNRQHLKEQRIHERDLAALRNHHDLLSTLFWAAPPDLRPNASRIETLVVPASSHKEACLINLRAWNQLARFVVASGEATQSFRPFAQWRNNLFEQMMKQYDSVASDIQQQLMALSKDDRRSVNSDVINTMVSMNKGAVKDVLHLSVTASLDVMKHALDLEAATFALNTPQLQLVFKHFAVAPPELDWSILRAALATLDSFLSRIEEFKDNEESQQGESQELNSAQADDGLQFLDDTIASRYFSMARCILSSRVNRDTSAAAAMSRASCAEQVVMLSARMWLRFIKDGPTTLSDMFKHGKYGLFDAAPHKLSLDQRRHLVLFVSTLLKYGYDDFHDAGFTLTEVWTLSIVKPREYLGYENQLATQLRRHESEYVPDAVVGLTISPDYNSNRDLFEFAVSTMRKSISDAGPILKKIRMADHAKTLKLVMEQIKGDLRTMADHAVEHPSYVAFVREIISLIRSHGPENCVVDDYFYQMSREYSPSVQDPQLQVASMVSYGLRLKEGEDKAAHQLFYFLFNNFKLSLNHDRLWQEARMLRNGMRNQAILEFVLGKMLPAIIRASSLSPSNATLLVDVYLEALRLLLDQTVTGRQLTEAELPSLAVTLRAIVDGIRIKRQYRCLSRLDLHLVRQWLAFLNLVGPSLQAMSLAGASGPAWTEATGYVKHIREVVHRVETYLKSLSVMDHDLIDANLLNVNVRGPQIEPQQFDSHVTSFADNIDTDIAKNWTMMGTRIAIRTPVTGRGIPSTQPGVNVEEPSQEAGELLQDLHERVKDWLSWWSEMDGKPSVKRYPMSVVI